MEERLILQALKKELEKEDKETGDSQWLLAVSVAPYQPTDRTAHHLQIRCKKR